MTPTYLTINENEFIPLASIKRIRAVSDDDRESLNKLNEKIDADVFRARLDLAENKRCFARESAEELADQGVALIEIEPSVFAPKDNIVKVQRITAKDRDGFAERTGREMRADFQSQVQMRSGKVLSTLSAEVILERIAGHAQSPGNTSRNPAVAAVEAINDENGAFDALDI
ncbi:MAG: hypothetical protein AAFR03_00500 [Pseudomonadota bacterium]